MGAALHLIDILWLGMFTLEFFAKVLALGFVRKPYSYCRRGERASMDSGVAGVASQSAMVLCSLRRVGCSGGVCWTVLVRMSGTCKH